MTIMVFVRLLTCSLQIWLTHCHIAWHTTEGLAVQMVERESELLDLIDADAMNSTCTAWNAYTNAVSLVQDDSGI